MSRKPVKVVVKCVGHTNRRAELRCSVRAMKIAISPVGVRWPHLDVKQVNDLICFLESAIAEVMMRENPKVFE